MEAKFSQRVKDVLQYSREEAVRLGNNYIGVEHLFLGILREGEGIAIQILNALHADLNSVKLTIEKNVANPSESKIKAENLPLVKQAEKALKITYLESKFFKSELIGTEHLLLAIVKDENNIVAQSLLKLKIGYTDIMEGLKTLIDFKQPTEQNIQETPKADIGGGMADDESEYSESGQGGSGQGKSRKSGESKSKTPVLDNFGRDMTRLAEENRLDPIVGRGKELERIAQILSRRKKNNPILIGEPGVGKSAIAEGLALKLLKEKFQGLCLIKD